MTPGRYLNCGSIAHSKVFDPSRRFSVASYAMSRLRSGNDSQMTVTANDHDEEDFLQKGLVAPRYMGTIADQRDMSALGRMQVLRVSGF